MRGAYGGGQARPRNPEDQPANPEPDGATWATRARNGGVPRVAAGHFRDLTFEAAPRVGMVRYSRTVRAEKVVNSRLTRLTARFRVAQPNPVIPSEIEYMEAAIRERV
jgi:hypothetical protein